MQKAEDMRKMMSKAKEELRAELIASSIKDIVRDITVLTDGLNSKEELKKAWNDIRLGLDYLSAKDSMFRHREELQNKLEE